MKLFIFRHRLVWFWTYLSLLTYELLLKNPWSIMGPRVAESPPFDTHSVPASASLHISSFLILGTLAGFAFIGQSEKKQVRYCMWLVAYAGITEVMQSFIPGRWASGEDVLFNVVGLILGALTFQQLFRISKVGHEPLQTVPA